MLRRAPAASCRDAVWLPVLGVGQPSGCLGLTVGWGDTCELRT